MRLGLLLFRYNISQSRLAIALGIPKITVWRWANGKTEPGIEMVQKMADFFGVTADEVVNGPAPLFFEIWIGGNTMSSIQPQDISQNHFYIGIEEPDFIVIGGKIRATTREELDFAKAKIIEKLEVVWRMRNIQGKIEHDLRKLQP